MPLLDCRFGNEARGSAAVVERRAVNSEKVEQGSSRVALDEVLKSIFFGFGKFPFRTMNLTKSGLGNVRMSLRITRAGTDGKPWTAHFAGWPCGFVDLSVLVGLCLLLKCLRC
jgi:hypothetical protein